MQRRDFSRVLASASVLSAGTVLGSSAWAQAAAPVPGLKAGSDYRALSTLAPVDAPAGQIEVVEFFAYSCIHCYNFEPLLRDWAKQLPANVVVRRTPVAFNAAFEPQQRLYYALEALGLLDTLHEKAFRAFHVDKQPLRNADAVIEWAVKQGLDKAKFSAAYNAFGLAGKIKRAVQLQNAYEVEGTPALGIAGRYYVPGQAAKTLVVANALIAQARKG
jgi:protein dithiol oxidoreductase (disulfide-forming)